MQHTSFGPLPRTRRSRVRTRLLLTLALLLASATLALVIVAHTQRNAQAAQTILETVLPGYEPWGLVQDHAGNIWVAEPKCDPGNISGQPFCSSTVQGNLIEYARGNFGQGAQPLKLAAEPPGYSSPFFVAADINNNIWFTEPVTNALGELDHLSHWHQWTVTTPGANPFDLTIDHYGHIWFTEPGSSAIGEFDPATQQFHTTPTPTANGDPYGITGPDPLTGSLWFTENNNRAHRIGRLTSAPDGSVRGRIQEYIAPATNNNTPHLITFDTRGNIWWTEGWAGNIGQLVISRAIDNTSIGVSEHSVPTPHCPANSNCGMHISGISVASNGAIWFDDSLSSRVGSYTPGGGFSLYTLEGKASSGAHPHDGLIVDSSNNVWLSEEFGNHLVEIATSPLAPAPTITPTKLKPTVSPTGILKPLSTACPGHHESGH